MPPAFAASSVTLAWNPSAEPDIAGYAIHYGVTSRSYTNRVEVGKTNTSGTVSNLATGTTYFFAATASNTLGLVSDYSDEVSYSVPIGATNLPPTVALTAPLNGANYTAPATINLAASVTANTHTITKVQFYNGATLLGEDTSTPYSFNWSNVSASSYSLTARAVYDAGSVVASSPANVAVTNPAPVSGLTFAADSGTITAPLVASNGSVSQTVLTGVTNGGRAAYVFAVITSGDYIVSANVSAPSLTQNSFYANIDAEPTDPLMIWDIQISTGLTNQTVSWRGNGNGDPALSQYIPKVFTLSVGTHQLIIRGREPNTTLGAITISPYGASTAPVVTLTSPLDGTSYTAPATINLAASVTANGRTITAVQFYNSTTLLGQATAAPYNFTWSSVSASTYSLTARLVYDGGSTLNSSPASVTVTNPPPTITLTTPANGASYTAPASISLAASVTANGHSITKVQFYNGATLLGEDTSTPYSFTWSSVSAGSYSLTARLAYDAGSTLDSSPASVTVTNPPPTITLTAPTNGASYTAPASISLAAGVATNGHTITKVQFYNSATLLGEDTSAPYSFTWSNVSAGSYSLTARAIYDAGSTVESSPVNINVTGLPAPWQTADIGSVGVGGSASMSNSIYTVKGAGNISGKADNFRFVYQPLGGDGEIKVCLNSVEDTGTSRRIGVMIRESLTSGSKYGFMGILPNGTFRWQRRSNTGGTISTSTTSAVGLPPNAWVRLVRTGDTFYGYRSTDGTNWTQVNSRSITMATNIYFGLAVASGSSNTLNTATFTNMTVVP